MRTALDGAFSLHAALRQHGGTVADNLQAPGDGPALRHPGPAQRAASGPRVRDRAGEYELLLEMILEGSRLHYGRPTVVRPDHPDLALLLGDQLYALGLQRLAEIGDLDAVAELADLISAVAQAHAAGTPELADQAWERAATAIGWGSAGR